MSDVSERPRPFTDRLAIDAIVTGAANDGSKRIGVPVEGKIGKFKGMAQKPFGPSPHFVMLDDCEHRF